MFDHISQFYSEFTIMHTMQSKSAVTAGNVVFSIIQTTFQTRINING